MKRITARGFAFLIAGMMLAACAAPAPSEVQTVVTEIVNGEPAVVTTELPPLVPAAPEATEEAQSLPQVNIHVQGVSKRKQVVE